MHSDTDILVSQYYWLAYCKYVDIGQCVVNMHENENVFFSDHNVEKDACGYDY